MLVFRAFIESERIVKPENAQQVLNMMYKEQELINKKRINLLLTLKLVKFVFINVNVIICACQLVMYIYCGRFQLIHCFFKDMLGYKH